MKFAGQHVIVTGGTRGIGASIAQAFLSQGATVVATYASNTQAAEDFKALHADKPLHIAKFDVRSDAEVEQFFQNWAFPTLDVLINNSGIRRDNLIAGMPTADWDLVLDTNLKGTYLMTKQAILLMMKARYGRIVNISSIGGKLGLPGQANYAASKAGQIALSFSTAKEVAKRNITINNVCPGFIETELISDLTPEQAQDYRSQIPMRRFGRPQEVAEAVLFLASREASYITGSVLDVSGGLNG